ncbi:hypothetical protein [Spirosoma sp. KNUC1025]|uniref:hypothetical protein n=1 Tax=Spirosoma sp. KNUC1025 TaxID=2894082 RepID=UPI0038660103|nr:hypothetical protein LN737_24425 [Spirosoma sp. KNUC1025]
MATFQTLKRLIPFLLLAVILGNRSKEAPKRPEKPTQTRPKTVANALPFTLEFVEKKYAGKSVLPRLQGYVVAPASDGSWLILGGRRQGLHTFEPAPATNFVRDSANHYLFVINPSNGTYWSFDVNQLSAKLSAPLQSTNQQGCFDRTTGQLYVVGGYGWKADKSDMLTFNTIMRIKVDAMVAAIKASAKPAQIASLIEIDQDDRLAVTGGELSLMNSAFYLVFGQKFMGQYRAFGGSDFEQKYTEEVRVFTLQPNSLKISSYGATTNSESDHPFHRRDGNIVEDIDPATGKPRIAAFGGVFMPGIIGAYTYPIYIYGPATPTVDRTGNQKFSQYGCPVIGVYDSGPTKAMYHTFFGGIGHYYYSQTAAQKKCMIWRPNRDVMTAFLSWLTSLLFYSQPMVNTKSLFIPILRQTTA